MHSYLEACFHLHVVNQEATGVNPPVLSTICFKRQLLLHHWTNFNETSLEVSLDDTLQKKLDQFDLSKTWPPGGMAIWGKNLLIPVSGHNSK